MYGDGPRPRLLLTSPVCCYLLVLRVLDIPPTEMNSSPQKARSSSLQPFPCVSSPLWIRTVLLTSFNLLPSFESAVNEIHVHVFVDDLTCLNQTCRLCWCAGDCAQEVAGVAWGHWRARE